MWLWLNLYVWDLLFSLSVPGDCVSILGHLPKVEVPTSDRDVCLLCHLCTKSCAEIHPWSHWVLGCGTPCVTTELSIFWSWPWQTSPLSSWWVLGAASGSACPSKGSVALLLHRTLWSRKEDVLDFSLRSKVTKPSNLFFKKKLEIFTLCISFWF